MEGVEAFLDGEWDSLSKLFSCEDSDIQLHFNGGGSDFSAAGVYGTPFMASHEQYCCVSQESSNTSESPAPNAAAAHDYLHHHHLEDSMNFSASMDAQMMPVFGDEMMEEILQLKAQMCNDNQVPQDSCNEMKPLGKRPRVYKDTQSRKKKKKGGCTEQSSSTCSSESNSNGKAAKASKGPATDAQSLYARKRRERINERLKMLQTLVPNGTKVDISTMLEEAVHYVKFLQLQIKLLSSDDMWMYAPIAYNGMDMGLYQKLNINPDTHN